MKTDDTVVMPKRSSGVQETGSGGVRLRLIIAAVRRLPKDK